LCSPDFMNFVKPIRDRKKITQIKNLLRGQGRFRDVLFTVGVNTALRRYKRRFWIHEQKRNKRHEVTINQSIQEALEEYLEAYPGVAENSEQFVFFNTKTNGYSEPIKRGKAWKFIVSICHEVGLPGNFGTHSLRKTCGYHARMRGVDLTLIVHKLNHESIAYTKRYLGITDDELEAVSQRLNL
jgi:site-specific recombinase XerD